MAQASTLAVLGAGALGAVMATRLGDTGHQVRLWNRTEERARAVADGAARVTAVSAVGDAVSGASVVITVLRDGDAVAEVMSGAIDRFDTDAVWVQASTVGPQSASALAALARDQGVGYLDAPVSGSTAPARQGKLVWLAAGTEGALASARPVLDDLGSFRAPRWDGNRGQRRQASGQRLDGCLDGRHERCPCAVRRSRRRPRDVRPRA
ncbi:NAD(P)-binding domain-containing protein [Streptomyces sp. NPDC006173]|uniref:NAD(P)-dependent oxidoreductase n=1 Tax=Streptomyces sp. NPDC006173 TaxID=3155349 RepID=UPI0034065A18